MYSKYISCCMTYNALTTGGRHSAGSTRISPNLPL